LDDTLGFGNFAGFCALPSSGPSSDLPLHETGGFADLVDACGMDVDGMQSCQRSLDAVERDRRPSAPESRAE
jgi:hypothetical protein